MSEIFGFDEAERDSLDFAGLTSEQMTDAVWKRAVEKYEKKEALIADPRFCTGSNATSCCRSSTRSGRITSTASTT